MRRRILCRSTLRRAAVTAAARPRGRRPRGRLCLRTRPDAEAGHHLHQGPQPGTVPASACLPEISMSAEAAVRTLSRGEHGACRHSCRSEHLPGAAVHSAQPPLLQADGGRVMQSALMPGTLPDPGLTPPAPLSGTPRPPCAGSLPAAADRLRRPWPGR